MSINAGSISDLNALKEQECDSTSGGTIAVNEDIKGDSGRSEFIEVSSVKENYFDLSNVPQSEVKLLNTKRMREEKQKGIEEEEEEIKPSNDPIILQVSSQNSIGIQWKDILNEFKRRNSNLNVAYGRFKDKEGHFVVFSPNGELRFTETLTIGGETLTVSKSKGDDLIDFWLFHGTHYESCMKNRKAKQKGKKVAHKVIKLGGKAYKDAHSVKAKAQEILKSNIDNEPLKGANRDFVLDLLKYHRDYKQKSLNMDYFTTGRQEKSSSVSKCFFIVKTNKEKVDFSIYKCLEVLEGKRKGRS